MFLQGIKLKWPLYNQRPMQKSSCSSRILSRVQVSLSDSLSHNPHTQDQTTLELSQQGISYIDILPLALSHSLHHLNLSRNCIKRLSNMAQFRTLRTLDISHNWIEDCNEIVYLKEILPLENLALQENPFLSLPMSLEVLVWLNTKTLDLELRSEDQQQILQQEALSNLLDLIFLESAVRVTSMHQEFMDKHLVYDQGQLNTSYLLQIKEKLKGYDPSTKSKYLQTLTIQAHNRSISEGISVVDAYTDIINSQNNQKIELIGILNKKALLINALRKKNKKVIEKNLSPIKAYDTDLTEDTVKLRFTPSFNEMPKTQKKRRFEKRNSQQESKYESRYYKNLTKMNPVYNLLYSPIHSLKPKEKDLLIESLSSDLKTMSISVYTKQEVTELNQQRLLQRVDQLQVTVRELQLKNHRLEEELAERLRGEMIYSRDRDRIKELQEELKGREEQISHLEGELVAFNEQCVSLQERIEEERECEEVLQSNHRVCAKREWMDLFKERCQHVRKIKQLELKSVERRSCILKIAVLKGLKMVANTTKRTNQLMIQRQKAILHQGFGFLLLNKNQSLQKKISHRLIDVINLRWKLRFFGESRATIVLRNQRLFATQYCQFRVKKRIFSMVKSEWIKCHNPTVDGAITQVGRMWDLRLLKRAFEGLVLNRRVGMEQKTQIDAVKKGQQHRLQQLESTLRGRIRSHLSNLFSRAARHLVLAECRNKKTSFSFQEYITNRRCSHAFVKFRLNSKHFLGHKSFNLEGSLQHLRAKRSLNKMLTAVEKRAENQKLVQKSLIKSLLKKQSLAFKTLKTLCAAKEPRAPPFELQEMEIRQNKLVRLNSLLKEEIESKEEESNLYLLKVQELQFSLTSQDIKYEQLLAVHEGSILEMRSRETQLLQLIVRLQQHKDYIPVADMKDNMKKARIFEEFHSHNSHRGCF